MTFLEHQGLPREESKRERNGWKFDGNLMNYLDITWPGFKRYCWCMKSCTSWYAVFRLCIPGDCSGFLPPTISIFKKQHLEVLSSKHIGMNLLKRGDLEMSWQPGSMSKTARMWSLNGATNTTLTTSSWLLKLKSPSYICVMTWHNSDWWVLMCICSLLSRMIPYTQLRPLKVRCGI